MNSTKTCSKCHETKLLSEFHNRKSSKDSKASECKRCKKESNRKYAQEHREEINKQKRNCSQEQREKRNERKRKWYNKTDRQKRGSISMYENKLCSLYLGIVIAEHLCRHLFKDVEVMPHGNPKFDFICNKGKLIDVKSSSTLLEKNKYPRWKFTINHNIIADYFICVAFDNVEDPIPIHLWMIPGKEINDQGSISVSPSTIHKWDAWKMDIKDAQICCAEMKNNS